VEAGHLCAAGRAQSGPEVEDDRLSLIEDPREVRLLAAEDVRPLVGNEGEVI
jgi:hypothetical protein